MRFQRSVCALVALLVLAASRRASAQSSGSTQGESASGAQGSIGGAGSAPARSSIDEHELSNLPVTIKTRPRAPTLPDLTHESIEGSFEQTVAAVKPKGQVDRLTSHLFHADFEIPLGKIAFVGAEYSFAAARSPTSDGARFVSGQPQIFGRAVYRGWRDHYALGAGLGLIAPVVTYDSLDDSKRVQTATASSLIGIVRPWDLSSYLDRRVTLRPWIDVRAGASKFVAQFRQGLDVAVRSGVASSTSAAAALGARVGDVEVISISTLYLGWQPSHELAIGVEAWEVYLLKTSLPIADRDRSVFAISPGLRFYYRWVEPGVSVLFPIGQPLLGSVDSYIALRIDLRVWFNGR